MIPTRHQIKDLDTLYFLWDQKPHPPREISIPVIPDKLSYSYTPSFTENSLLGRLSPIFMYSGGSDRTYTFSVSIHRDMVQEGIVDFIDSVKSLSYPVKEGKEVKFPKVYFQLGEIMGYGIVKTSISWSKPFDIKAGGYAMVEISFTITVENAFSPVVMVSTSSVEEAPDIVYSSDYKMNAYLSSTDFSTMQSMAVNLGYDSSQADFVDFMDSNNTIIDTRKRMAIQEFNVQAEKLAGIYGIFEENFGVNMQDIDFLNQVQLGNYSYKALSISNKRKNDQVYKAKVAFKNYLDEYYESSKTMTKEQYNAILEDVFRRLSYIQELSEEIISYGSSS